MKKILSSRAIAAQLLVEVIQKQRSLSAVLNDRTHNVGWATPRNNTSDRGFVQELCYGVLRWHEQLNALLAELMKKPLKQPDQDIHALLLVGLYQLIHLQTKPYAALHATVQAARELQKPWAAALINGVLRAWQRQSAALQTKIQQNPAARYAHPAWLLTLLQQAWPDQWATIADANNQHPPLTLRVNQLHQTRAEYLQRLSENNIVAQPTEYTQNGITLATPQDVMTLPGFASGDVSVQDAAGQLAAELLELAPAQSVLDACAAPGGKTAHILETEPELTNLVSMDIDAARLKKVQENLTRLGFEHSTAIQLLCANAGQPNSWNNNDGQLFDRILLDAPCSATGVIRRHPDIKLLRQATDIPVLVAKQIELLNALWPLLKPGGLLLYATCSVLPQENWQVLQSFLAQHPDAREKPIVADWGIAMPIGRQILPQAGGMDGFYYGRLEKQIV